MSKSDLIDIACVVRQQRDKSIAIADGTMEDVVDEKTGEVREREKWFWLPRSQVDIDHDNGTVTMPEWLAEEKGLI